MLLSVHIPKTAGTSFRRILEQVFGRDLLLNYWELTDLDGHLVKDIPPNIRCIHGHFVPDSLMPRFPGADLLTWVRDPVERIVSSYHHHLNHPDWRHPVHREVHEKKLTLLQFASLESLRNEMSHYFGGKAPAEFRFIGLAESFEGSLRRFHRRLGLKPVAPVFENRNPARAGESYEIDDATRSRIAALNERDMDLYADCRRIVAEREQAAAR